MKLTPRAQGGFFVRCTELWDEKEPETMCMSDRFHLVKLPDGRLTIECEDCNVKYEVQEVLNARE